MLPFDEEQLTLNQLQTFAPLKNLDALGHEASVGLEGALHCLHPLPVVL